MAHKSKKQGFQNRDSETKVNLGTVRKQKIKRYRAQEFVNGVEINSIEEVVLIAVDQLLERELKLEATPA